MLLSGSIRPETPPEPIEDPILSVVKPGPQPAGDGVRTTLAAAKRSGFAGFLQLFGPGRLSLALTGITSVFMAVAAITMFVTMFAGH